MSSDMPYDYILDMLKVRKVKKATIEKAQKALESYARMEQNLRDARKLVDDLCMKLLGHPLAYKPENGEPLQLVCPRCGKLSTIYARVEEIDDVSFGIVQYKDKHCEIDFDDSNIEGMYTYCCDNCGYEVAPRMEYLEILAGKPIEHTILNSKRGDKLFDVYKFDPNNTERPIETLSDIRAYGLEDAFAKAAFQWCKHDVNEFVMRFDLKTLTFDGWALRGTMKKEIKK